MNYLKSTLSKSKSKANRRIISGGEPAERKRKSIFDSAGSAGSGSASHGQRIKPESAKKKALPKVAPWKVILASILVATCGLLYISHVFSTQQTLMEVQQLENEFNKAQRIYEEQRLSYDRMVGPKEIYQQARQQGFINAGPADQIIISEP